MIYVKDFVTIHDTQVIPAARIGGRTCLSEKTVTGYAALLPRDEKSSFLLSSFFTPGYACCLAFLQVSVSKDISIVARKLLHVQQNGHTRDPHNNES